MLKLIYCTMEMPSDQIKKIYRTMHEHSIPHEVIQNPYNNSVYTIKAEDTKKTAPVLKRLGFT